MTERIVISKSSKKKMTSGREKANGYTEEVVYKTKLENGKFKSRTRHELRSNS